MRQKIIGAGIAVMLVSLAAVGAFASQDGVNLLATPADTLAVGDTPTVTDTTTATETASATDTPTATATDTAGRTATPTGTATPVGIDTATSTATPGGIGTATATATPGGIGTATATATPNPSSTPGDGEEEDTRGIPTSNPSHHPEDGDGVCEHGETVVKTTPSGNKVTVPCQTEKHGKNHAGGNQTNGHGKGSGSD